jgi:NAD(P)H-hydrate epimerase
VNTENLPDKLYTVDNVRELDRLAIEDEGIPAITLMRRAGAACVELLMARWPTATNIWVICGGGNNAGDGYIIAGLLAEHHCQVSVRRLGDPAKASPATRVAYEYCLQSGIVPEPFDIDEVMTANVVVDALLGIGVQGELRPAYRQLIQHLNQSGLPVLAVDIPSGLCADTGVKLGDAIRADVTVTFLGLKRGLFTEDGPDCAGDIVFDSLGLADKRLQQVACSTEKLRFSSLLKTLPRRPRNAHKNRFGHVLVVGGDQGMGGAVAMTAEAALRSGAGLVSVATHPVHATAILGRCPELMVRGTQAGSELTDLIARASVVVLGPGLGQSDWSRTVFNHVLKTVSELGRAQPMVVDADGLNLLAQRPERRDSWVLTPHPGEASRLLGISAPSFDRFADVARLQSEYGGVVVLKGVGSLVADGELLSLCPYGNPGMATAGMGDILSGIIAALLSQAPSLGLTAMQATQLAVATHALAGDAAAVDGQRGMIATDTLPYIRRLLNGL